MWEYLEKAIEDTLFLRIVFVLWAVPFLIFFIWCCIEYTFYIERPLLLFFPLALFSMSIFLAYVGVFGSSKAVGKYSGYLNEGGEFIGIIFVIFVVILALPLWEILRRNKNSA